MTAALLAGRPVVVTPDLVRVAGGSVTRAAVLQQIHWHLNEATNDNAVLEYDDRWWVAITYVDLGGELGLSAEKVRRAIEWLERPPARPGEAERQALLVSVQPENYYRRKWYRINEDHPDLSDSSNRQNRQMQSAESPSRSGESADTPLLDAENDARATQLVQRMFEGLKANDHRVRRHDCSRVVADARARGVGDVLIDEAIGRAIAAGAKAPAYVEKILQAS